jgi:hypothetical protein
VPAWAPGLDGLVASYSEGGRLMAVDAPPGPPDAVASAAAVAALAAGGPTPPAAAGAGFALGEVVWARMLSYPWWPAQVVPPAPGAHHLRHKPDSIFVVFFGDGNCAWLSARSLDKFAGGGFGKRAAKAGVRGLQDAVDAGWAALGRRRPDSGRAVAEGGGKGGGGGGGGTRPPTPAPPQQPAAADMVAPGES